MYILEVDNEYNFDVLGVFSTTEEAEAYAHSYADNEVEGGLISTEPSYEDYNNFFFETDEQWVKFRIKEATLNPVPLESGKQTYTVNLEYHDFVTLSIVAKSAEEAKEKAIDQWTENHSYEYDDDGITVTIEEEEE